MKVTLLAHRGHVVVLPAAADLDSGWVPTGNRAAPGSSRVSNYCGSVLLDTRSDLSASEEALRLLADIRNGRDAIGDWDWWACADGKYACSWFGPIFRLIDPRTAVGARGTAVHRDQVTVVPNDVPPELAAEVEAALLEGRAYFREPVHLSDPEPPERNN